MAVVEETFCTTQLSFEIMVTNTHAEFNLLELSRLLFGFRDRVWKSPKNTEKNRDPYARSPISLFNYLGGSTCGVLSANFSILCAAIGLKARVERTAYHTTTEVQVGDRWVIMDPDPSNPPIYPSPSQPERLLGLGDILTGDGRVLKRLKWPITTRNLPCDNDDGRDWQQARRQKLRDRKREATFLSAQKRKSVAQGDDMLDALSKQSPLDIGMKMFPRERAIFGYDMNGPWLASSMPLSRPPMSRSLLVREFDIVDAEDLSHLRSSGIFLEQVETDRRLGVEESSEGYLCIPIDNAYPILDIILTVKGGFAGKAMPVVRTQLGSEMPVGIRPVRGSDVDRLQFRLRRVLVSSAVHEPLTLHLLLPSGSKIESIRVLSLCQVSRVGLPKLRPGENRFAYTLDGSETNLEIAFSYTLGHTLPSAECVTAIAPADRSVIRIDDLLALRWDIEGGESHDTGSILYQVSVAHDPEMVRVVCGNLYRITADHVLPLDDDDRFFLRPGRTYFWRVRIISDILEPLSEWSTTFQFTTAEAT